MKRLFWMILLLTACSDESQARITAAMSLVGTTHIQCSEDGVITYDITCTGEPYTPRSGQITCIDAKTHRGVTVYGHCVIRY